MDYKLGKAPPRIDNRTLKLGAVFKAARIPDAPDNIDVDELLGVRIDNPMFANDTWGDCVMALRAHMTRRFEQFEQKKVLPITDDDVLNEYWKEQGYVPSPVKLSTPPKCWLARLFWKPPVNPSLPVPNGPYDGGLVGLNSLNAWRKGWKAAGQDLNIYAFSAINWKNPAEVKAALYYLKGTFTGLALPISARGQDIWDIDTSANGKPGSWGLHAVYRKRREKAITKVQYTFISWGREQPVTEEFCDAYIDEDYAVVDDRDRFLGDSPVDVEALDAILKGITG